MMAVSYTLAILGICLGEEVGPSGEREGKLLLPPLFRFNLFFSLCRSKAMVKFEEGEGAKGQQSCSYNRPIGEGISLLLVVCYN